VTFKPELFEREYISWSKERAHDMCGFLRIENPTCNCEQNESKPLKIIVSFNNKHYFKNRILCYAFSWKIFGTIWLCDVSVGVYVTTSRYRKHGHNNISISHGWFFFRILRIWECFSKFGIDVGNM